MSNAEARACEMLRVAATYIRETYPDAIIHYDDAECDGYCVAEDCESAAETLAADLTPSPEVVAELVEALRECTDWMERLRASGDAGFWDWEDDEYTRAMAVLAKLEGGE